MKINVLYEDNHLIAVEKPAGVLTQEDQSRDENLMDQVKGYLKEKYKKPGNVFLGLLHRLDRNASGIVLFAKTSKGASRLSEQFRGRKIGKIYHAIVIGKPQKAEGILAGFIKKDEQNKKALVAENGEGQAAELYYETVTYNDKYSLLRIRIKTGRFHQIRAQMASIGCPILGDVKYGAPFALLDKSIALCATSLSFQTATTKENKQISIPAPEKWQEYIK